MRHRCDSTTGCFVMFMKSENSNRENVNSFLFSFSFSIFRLCVLFSISSARFSTGNAKKHFRSLRSFLALEQRLIQRKLRASFLHISTFLFRISCCLLWRKWAMRKRYQNNSILIFKPISVFLLSFFLLLRIYRSLFSLVSYAEGKSASQKSSRAYFLLQREKSDKFQRQSYFHSSAS